MKLKLSKYEEEQQNLKFKKNIIKPLNNKPLKKENISKDIETFYKVLNSLQKIYFLQIFLLFINNLKIFLRNLKIFKQLKYFLIKQLQIWIISLLLLKQQQQLQLIFKFKQEKENLVVILINNIKNYLLLKKYLKHLLQLAFVVQYINATIINKIQNKTNNNNYKNIINNIKKNYKTYNLSPSQGLLKFLKNSFYCLNNFANFLFINIVRKKTSLLLQKYSNENYYNIKHLILRFLQNFNFFLNHVLTEIFLGIQQKFKLEKLIEKFLKASTELLKKSTATKNLMALNKLSSRIFLE